MQNIILNTGQNEFANCLAYTELSSVHNMDNIAFDPMINLSQFIEFSSQSLISCIQAK